jgi:CheY-like chemotaxis protein
MGNVSGSARPVVLIVDADEDTRALYRVVLADLAGSVEEACDGVEGYGRALSRPPDLVVMEKRLPRMDGFALLERLRAEPSCRRCAVLLVTTDASVRDGGGRPGIDEVLLKPCDVRELASAARRLTDRTLAADGGRFERAG